jgi:hypothetical protein
MIDRISALCALVALGSVAGCAGMSEQACLTADWQVIGFEDGAAGRNESRIGTYRRECADHGLAPDLNAYRAGHADGVQVYCRASNGFSAGHNGAVYQGVCPADLEADFLAEYNAGRHLFELESALRQIDSQLAHHEREQASIQKELTAIGIAMVADGTSAEDRLALVADTANLGKRHAELASEIEALREERIVVAQELNDYRETLAFGS